MKTFKIITDETLRETIQHGNNRYPFAYYLDNIWEFDFHRIDWHWHHEFEFLYIVEGTALCLIGENKIGLKKGYGIFYNNNMFVLDDRKNIIAVKNKDNQDIKKLYGYEIERNKVLSNTKILIEGKKANNILLYGDAGTGKSSTVKAVANFFKDEGLRLIEIKKNQLHFITDIIEKLSCSPLKFIIFIDDLTFSSNDDTFSYLKAILEGGVNSFPNNIAVYVTSNYRHLIKENFTDRDGDDIHIEDTIQQIMSLTNRFGTIITFQRPDRDLFSEIVLSYAKENDIKIDKEELIKQAEAYAIRSAGRSPRVAKQFIELLKQ